MADPARVFLAREVRLGGADREGSDRNAAGGCVVTYAVWPLYTYVADTHARVGAGQTLNLNGGLW